MTPPVNVLLFFNYRSPYCYLASRKMWTIEDDHGGRFDFKPLGGWNGRSAPDRAKAKLPIARQDVRRFAKRMNIPFVPPPVHTDPTNAALGALVAIDRGKIREYTIEVMRREWAEGKDIGDRGLLGEVASTVGLDASEIHAALDDPARHAVLEANAALAASIGVFGVPTFVVGEEIFWGQDRIDFVTEYLDELRASTSAPTREPTPA